MIDDRGAPSSIDWSVLDAQVGGRVLRAADGPREPVGPDVRPGPTPRPRAVLVAAGTGDVAAALSFAARHRTPLAVRSGGHDFAGRSSTDGLLIDLRAMSSVRVHGETVTVGPGALLGELYPHLDAAGRAVAGGGGMAVGIAGLVLGGGLGILGRTHGLTCDALLGAQVVLPDGRVVECDAEHEPELLWALRGGGAAGLGVVTRLDLRTVRTPAMTAFALSWDHRHTAALLDAWQHWAPASPDGFAASLLLTAPADPTSPPQALLLGAAVEIGPAADRTPGGHDLAGGAARAHRPRPT